MKRAILALAVLAIGFASCKKEVDSKNDVNTPVSTKTVEVRLGGGNSSGTWYWNTNGEILTIDENNKTVKAILDDGEFIQVGGSFTQFYAAGTSNPLYSWLYASVIADGVWLGNNSNSTSSYTYTYTNE